MTETEISCADAKDIHGVNCTHGRMPNGELRFRLLKNDGTAYIRTESPPGGGWQNSHYHDKVKETYIVQQGWIGYAEMVDEEPQLRVYREGESFTTKPLVIHNVYMPAGVVIHTVKHGDSAGERRLEDDRTDRFTKLTNNISEEELLRSDCTSTRLTRDEVPQEPGDYSEAYRHFDNLIWQVSAWSTAVFAVVLGGTSRLEAGSPIVTTTGLRIEAVMALVFGLFGTFILVLSYALYRFRWHQIRIKKWRPLFSPQVGLQIMVNVQAVVLLIVPLLSRWRIFSLVIAVVLFSVLTVIEESKLIRVGKAGNKPRGDRS